MAGQAGYRKKLQIFVSSTFQDLQQERQAAVAAILKAGHIPAGMELFTAGDKSQLEIIKRWIDESDVYLLILGGRYGSKEPETGVSYTELEFDYAREQGKALFSIVISDKELDKRVKKTGLSLIDDKSARDLFKDKALSNISSFFDDEKDIRLAIHESLSDFSRRDELKGWVRASTLDEIDNLRGELAILKSSASSVNQSKTVQNSDDGKSESNSDFAEIEDIIRNIYIDIPESVRGTSTKEKRTLLDLLYTNYDNMIPGYNNYANMNAAAKFMYFNVMPKLQVYGLADNEPVPGQTYRRAFITAKGQRFVAGLERKRHDSSLDLGGVTVKARKK